MVEFVFHSLLALLVGKADIDICDRSLDVSPELRQSNRFLWFRLGRVQKVYQLRLID